MSNKQAGILLVLGILAIIGLAVGVRILKANLVYHDSRCAFASCRIIKE